MDHYFNEIESEDLIKYLEDPLQFLPPSTIPLEFSQEEGGPPPQEENNVNEMVDVYQDPSFNTQCAQDYNNFVFVESQAPQQITQETTVYNFNVNSIAPSTGLLPSTDEYEGPFGFKVLFKDPGKKCHYSDKLNKIFIKSNKVFLVEFTSTVPADQLFFIRALMVFSATQFASEPVKRCNLHSVDDDPHLYAHQEEDVCGCGNYNKVGHVVRSELPYAMYCYDPSSKRHSVLTSVPQLQPGAHSISVPYVFKCQTTCESIQRRPANIIFTLENKNFEVVGRHSLNIKICTCPKRDKDREEGVLTKDNKEVQDKIIPQPAIKTEAPQCDLPLILPSTGVIPSQNDFEGPFGFNISLGTSGKNWHFSEMANRVFIKINNVLMVQFKTVVPVDTRYYIRALMMYSDNEYCNEPVMKCTDHAAIDDPHLQAHRDDVCNCASYNNVGHVIKSDLSDSIYCYDINSKRHSVLRNCRTLQAGCDTINIPYIFTCQTSCNSMQRRSTRVVFTLEDEMFQVVGRRVLEVKICCCPKRDKLVSEGLFGGSKTTKRKSSEVENTPIKTKILSPLSEKKDELLKSFVKSVKSLVNTLDEFQSKENEENSRVAVELNLRSDIVKSNLAMIEQLL